MLLLAEPRFHLPMFPLIAILAAYTLIEHPWKVSKPWQRALALIFISLLVLNWITEIVLDREMLSRLFGPDGHHLSLTY